MEGRSTVLFVEDDPSLRDWWCGSLQDIGYEVLSGGAAAEALVIARQAHAPFDLAVLDLGLPPHPNDPTEGLELLRLLILERPSLKVIVLTGQDEPAVALTAIGLGAFDFLNKPASIQRVKEALARAVLFLQAEKQLNTDGQARMTLTAPMGEGVREFGEAAQEKLVRSVLADTQFNVAQASRKLGLTREHLYYFMKKFGIERAPS
ncbi:response regulator [Polaromonas sp.]|uniref:response regulator n=1 Tax=Polaromonas sp. TaxID=1869339 RepID=UPI002487F292|nr:response regulator [Polaromonas sp.]MDI1274573.1 response regulator [Polaromonas sp.]